MNNLVTVGITSYNAEKTIERSINSALIQSYKNIEIIIVDDASTDNTINVIQPFIINNNNIKLFRHEINKGPSGSRNTIINNALGEYVIFFDDDDESSVNRIAVQKEYLDINSKKKQSKLVLCYASGKRLYNSGYNLQLPAIGSILKPPSGNQLKNFLLFNKKITNVFYGSGVPTCSLMTFTITLKTLGLFDQNLRRVEDADLAIRLMDLDGFIIGTKEKLFIQYSTLAPDKNPYMNFNAEQFLINKNYLYLNNINMYEYSLLWSELRYNHFIKNYFKFIKILLILLYKKPIYTFNHFIISSPRRLFHEIKMYNIKNVIPNNIRSLLRLFLKKILYNYRFFLLKFAIINKKNINLILGAAQTYQKNWYSSNEQWLDISNASHWKRLFKKENTINLMLSEHVFEHLTYKELSVALKLIYKYLRINGRIRIAVPDGNNPNLQYIKNININGIGADAKDHKQLLNYEILYDLLIKNNFEPILIEGFINNKLILDEYDDSYGYIIRSRKRKYKINNDREWNFPDSNTSLIIDAIKK